MFHICRLPWKGGTATWVAQPADGGEAGTQDPGKDLLSGPEDWPGVEWPTQPIGKNAAQTGTGNWGTFTMGNHNNSAARSLPSPRSVPRISHATDLRGAVNTHKIVFLQLRAQALEAYVPPAFLARIRLHTVTTAQVTHHVARSTSTDHRLALSLDLNCRMHRSCSVWKYQCAGLAVHS